MVSDRKLGQLLYDYTYSAGAGSFSYNSQSNEFIYTGSGSNYIQGSNTSERNFDSYLPEVLSYSDYYPFHMQMPGRNDNSGGYRYQGQGQEEDNEFTEGMLAFEYRVHDPRIGRFLSVDPLRSNYPQWSSYTFSGNRVIDMIEMEGLEPTTPKSQWKKTQMKGYDHGVMYKVDNEHWIFQTTDQENLNILHYQWYNGSKWETFYPQKEPEPSCLSCELTDLMTKAATEITLEMLWVLDWTLTIVTLGEAKILIEGAKFLLKNGAKSFVSMYGKNVLKNVVIEVAAANDIPIISPKDLKDGLGIIYRRINKKTGKVYIGQAKNKARYEKRQLEHAKANPDEEYSFEVIGQAEEGVKLDVLEEDMIRTHGVPNETIENSRYQMNDPKYRENGGKIEKKK